MASKSPRWEVKGRGRGAEGRRGAKENRVFGGAAGKSGYLLVSRAVRRLGWGRVSTITLQNCLSLSKHSIAVTAKR